MNQDITNCQHSGFPTLMTEEDKKKITAYIREQTGLFEKYFQDADPTAEVHLLVTYPETGNLLLSFSNIIGRLK